MKIDIPAWGTLGPVKNHVGIGKPIRIRITQDLEEIPELEFRDKVIPKKGFYRREGNCFLFREPDRTRWLLAAFCVTDSSLDWSHQAQVEEYEPANSVLGELRTPVNLTIRQVRSSTKFLDFSLTKKHMKELEEKIGKAHPSFLQLMPGRTALSIRYINDLDKGDVFLQIWIPLE